MPSHSPSTLDVGRVAPPRHGVLHHLAGLALKSIGWAPEGDPPDLPRYVLVAAPHTSWMDGFLLISLAAWWDLQIHWLVKSTAVRGPLGWMMRKAGAIAVDRSAPRGLVSQLAQVLASHERFVLVVPAEGTRGRREYWKSGFYHIAREANVPVCLGFMDYGRKRAGLGPCFYLTGDVHADMDRIRAFYKNMKGKYPEKFTPPRLREEDAAESKRS